MQINNAGVVAQVLRVQQQFCGSACVKTTLPACRVTSLDSSIAAHVNQIYQGIKISASYVCICKVLLSVCKTTACATLPSGGQPLVYTFIALLSSVIFAGVAAMFL